MAVNEGERRFLVTEIPVVPKGMYGVAAGSSFAVQEFDTGERPPFMTEKVDPTEIGRALGEEVRLVKDVHISYRSDVSGSKKRKDELEVRFWKAFLGVGGE